MDGSTVNKEKVVSYFNDFAKTHGVWAPVIQHTKAACITVDIPPQGIDTNCPAYDIMMCGLASFIKVSFQKLLSRFIFPTVFDSEEAFEGIAT
jgi:hypothetical protein